MKKFFKIIIVVFIFCFQLLLQNVILATTEKTSREEINYYRSYKDIYAHDVNVSTNGAVFCVNITGNLTISSSTFISNNASGYGGAIYNEGYVNITDGVIFSSNTASDGGAIYNCYYTTMEIKGEEIVFSFNKATSFFGGFGGAIYNIYASNMKINGGDIIFNSNIAENGYGGAIFNDGFSKITISGDNSSASDGGAIANYENSTITISGGDIVFSSNVATGGFGGAVVNRDTSTAVIKGTNTIFSSNIAENGYGGAIGNNNNSKTTIDSTQTIIFSSNSAASGGAIYNFYSTIMEIKGEDIIFSSNTADSSGAIDNSYFSTMTIRGGDIVFNSNTATNVFGGAISNDNSSIVEMVGRKVDFISNTANSSGGAFYNAFNSTITIRGEDISFSSNTSSYSGGTIYNNFNSVMGIIGKKIDFIFNAAGKEGGAVHNEYNSTMAISGEDIIFNNNTAGNYGGAVYNFDSNLSIKGEKIKFSSNTADSYGGAIYNSNSTMTISGNDVVFSSNTTQYCAGAIYNSGSTLNLKKKKKMEFTGNAAKGESNAIYDSNGTINLYASERAEIIFNDRITSQNSNSILNINQSTTTLNAIGKIVLNEDMTGFKGAVNLYNGEIELKAKVEEDSNINKNKFFSGSITLSGGTLNIQNGVIDDIKVTNLTSTANANLKFDVDLSNDTSDNFTIINTASGKLNLISINIIGVKENETSGKITLFNRGKSPELNILTTGNYGGTEYVFKYDDFFDEGTLVYKFREFKTFKQTVNETETEYRSYTLAVNEMIEDNLVALGGKYLTIFGENKNIEGKNIDGIYVSKGKSLDIYNVSKWSGFNGTYGAIKNEGNLFIYETNFEDNYSQDIINNGDLWLSSNCYFKSGIIGTGTTTISGKVTSDGIIKNSIYVYKDSVLKNNGTLIVNDGTNNGTITSDVDISSMTIIGNFVNNNKIKQNNMSIENNAILTLTQNSDIDVANYLITAATIDMANAIIQEHNFNNLTINGTLNLAIDADLANKQMDTITANEDSDIQGKINVKAINILEDATENKTEILFTSSTVLKDKITAIKTVNSSLYKYNVGYNDGYFIFDKCEINGTEVINPIIAESQVATAVGGLITQKVILNQAFASIDSAFKNKKQNYNQSSNDKNIKTSNLYASSANLLYTEDSNKIEKGLWIRPYTIQDTIKINNISVDNSAVGTLAGLDLSVGENSSLSFYIGYAGSTQKYEDIKVNQTGYVIGATGMLIKENYYLGLTANINFNKAESENDYGTDKFDMNMYALGAKAGYDIYLGEKWIIEPNLTLMYGNINTPEYTTKQGALIDSQSTNNILIEPQVKAKLNLANGWTPYALVGYILNAGNKTKLVANNIAFDDMQISGYAEYGLGVNKSFKDSLWSCFVQVVGRGGDKNGFEGNIGIKYSL